jgi:hypothetical protein
MLHDARRTTRAQVIAVNQDALGAQARRVWSSEPSAAAASAFRHIPDATLAGGRLWREETLSLAGARAMCALGGKNCSGFTMASASPDPDVRVTVQLFADGKPRPVVSNTAHTYVKIGAPHAADWQEVWAGPLVDGAVAVVLFNRGSAPRAITARWADIGLCSEQHAAVRDLWLRKRVGVHRDAFTATVQPHGACCCVRSHARKPCTDPGCCCARRGHAARHALGATAVVHVAGHRQRRCCTRGGGARRRVGHGVA